jgi:hypothetical protein
MDNTEKSANPNGDTLDKESEESDDFDLEELFKEPNKESYRNRKKDSFSESFVRLFDIGNPPKNQVKDSTSPTKNFSPVSTSKHDSIFADETNKYTGGT